MTIKEKLAYVKAEQKRNEEHFFKWKNEMRKTSDGSGVQPSDVLKQYCRYCAFCFEAGDDEFRCSDHPKGKQPHWKRKQINRENHCPNFALSDLGDTETGKPYRPLSERRRARTPEEIMLKKNQVSFL